MIMVENRGKIRPGVFYMVDGRENPLMKRKNEYTFDPTNFFFFLTQTVQVKGLQKVGDHSSVKQLLKGYHSTLKNKIKIK